MKPINTLIIFILSTLLTLTIVFLSSGENPSWAPKFSPQDNHITGWQLGNEIIPYPFHDGETRDCDDGTLYSFYYLENLRKELDIKIIKGQTPWYPQNQHVWLEVSDNSTTIVYDLGLPWETELYKGREISLKQLAGFVYRDL